MATTASGTLTFSSDSFIDSKPGFFKDTYIKGYKYSNTGVTMAGIEKIYGYITVDITFNGTAKYAGVSFQSPPPISSTFSVGVDGIDGLFFRFYDGKTETYDVKLENGVTRQVLIIINGDPDHLTSSLNILGCVGIPHTTAPTGDNTIDFVYSCHPTPLYEYPTGLHVYSPYDSITQGANPPKLTTKLWSKTPNSTELDIYWQVGTRVWSSPWFDFPSPEYFYGYDEFNNIYQVGTKIDRSWGTKTTITLKSSYWRAKVKKKQPKRKYKVEGPKSYYHQADDTVDSCIDVKRYGAGLISKIIPKSDIPQPTKYKYWMGYDLTSKQKSNDDWFVKWVFNQSKFYAITGFLHMMYKFLAGYGESTDFNFDASSEMGRYGAPWWTLLAIGLPLLVFDLLSVILPSLLSTTVSAATIASVEGACTPTALSVLANASAAAGPWGWIVTAIILLVWLSLKLFKQKTVTLTEACRVFLGEYTTTPYIELGSSLNRRIDLTPNNSGYFCDGAYFYTQPTIAGITVKELSSTPNCLVGEDPIKLQFAESLIPDDPTFVISIPKLLFLPYTSGMPVEYDGTVYESAARGPEDISLTPDCGELVTRPATVPLTLPAGFCTSYTSQAEADACRDAGWNKIVSIMNDKTNYSELLSEENLGVIDCCFTHEIRVETNPTASSLFYNNTDQLGRVIGRKVFFDMEGKYEVMKGYYAAEDTAFYRTFYKVENSIITNIYTMVSSSSTTVQGSPGILSVNTINLGYSSSWYLESSSAYTLAGIIGDIASPRCFDPNTLYGESYVVRGYYDSTNLRFYLYGDNYNNYTISDAPADWYQPLIEWFEEQMFYYSPVLSVAIDIEEICLPTTAYENALYGFYVIGSSGGNICPLYNQVNLTVNVYVGPTLKHTYTVVTNESGKTYVPYGAYVLITDDVTSIVITSINSTNPIGNITYTIGTFASCSGCVTTDPFATGLQACWNFEEASGTVYDSTANNHDLTLNNNVVYHQAGKIGSYATQFNTSTSYLQGDTGLNLSPTMSISVWVKVVGVTSYNRYIYNKAGFGVNRGVVLYVEPGGKPVFGILYGTNINPTGADVNVNDGTWHHIVATMDINILRVCMYVDGVPDLLNPHPCSTPDYGDNNTRITIGNTNLLNTFALYGLLDGLAVWDRVLTPCEVKTLYNSGSGLACV